MKINLGNKERINVFVYRPWYHILLMYTKFATLNFVVVWDCGVFINAIILKINYQLKIGLQS